MTIVKGSHPQDAPHTESTITLQLARTAAHYGTAVAFIEQGRRVTWAEVDAQSDRLAGVLLETGIQPGECIGGWLANSIDWVIVWLAAIKARAIFVPLNTRLAQRELEYVLSNASPRFIFAGHFDDTNVLMTLREAVRSSPEANRQTISRSPLGVENESAWADFLRSGYAVSKDATHRTSNQASRDDPAIAVYTSGSTGHPKGVIHSHKLLRNEAAIAWYLGVEHQSRILGHMPFYHVAGGLSAVVPALITGAQVILMDKWNNQKAAHYIDRYDVTIFGGIATHYVDLLAAVREEKTSTDSLRSGWIGGAFNPRDVMEAATDELGFRPLPAYGMTETTSVTTYPLPDDDDETVYSGRGRPISDFEIAVADIDTGSVLPTGEAGEILVRGHVVMAGYLGGEGADAPVEDGEGWFHTGDVGVIDEWGYLSVTGRLKEMYIVGGNNVFPNEVERAFQEHPEVLQAHVVAVPDARLGEVGVAFVQVTQGKESEVVTLQTYLNGRLSGYKIPRIVKGVSEWPLTTTGKVDKRALREQAMDAAGILET